MSKCVTRHGILMQSSSKHWHFYANHRLQMQLIFNSDDLNVTFFCASIWSVAVNQDLFEYECKAIAVIFHYDIIGGWLFDQTKMLRQHSNCCTHSNTHTRHANYFNHGFLPNLNDIHYTKMKTTRHLHQFAIPIGGCNLDVWLRAIDVICLFLSSGNFVLVCFFLVI